MIIQLNNPFNWTTRIGRLSYFVQTVIGVYTFYLVAYNSPIDIKLDYSQEVIGLILIVNGLISFLPPFLLFCATARRLNDVNRSRWWVFAVLATPLAIGYLTVLAGIKDPWGALIFLGPGNLLWYYLVLTPGKIENSKNYARF